MKILLVNKYLYPRGGAEISTLRLHALLTEQGHQVVLWGMEHPENIDLPHKNLLVSNIDFNDAMKSGQQLKAALRILYSFEARSKVEKIIKQEKPDIVHLNNFAHQLSPSILSVFRKYDLPVVMTLRDYKLVCPTYLLFLGGSSCELCKNGHFYHCLLNRCTKNSYAKSLVNVMEMYLHHNILKSFSSIDLFIAASDFARSKIIEMGFPWEISVLTNFVDTRVFTPDFQIQDRSIAFFGRLSKEKGILTLLKAVTDLDVQVKIIGDGPYRLTLEEKIRQDNLTNVKLLGFKYGLDLAREIGQTLVTVLPSVWYEPFGNAIIESYAMGKPVIASSIGGINEFVKDGETGFTFEPQNHNQLRDIIEKMLKTPQDTIEMGKRARQFVIDHFDAPAFYKKLICLYQKAIKNHGSKPSRNN